MALLFTALLAGCRPTEKQWEPNLEQPENLMSEAQMIAFLTQAHIIEGAAIESNLAVLEQHARLKEDYGQVCANLGVTLEQVRSSYDYYIHKPITMHTIYRRVIEELTKTQAEFEQLTRKEAEAEASEKSEEDTEETDKSTEGSDKQNTPPKPDAKPVPPSLEQKAFPANPPRGDKK